MSLGGMSENGCECFVVVRFLLELTISIMMIIIIIKIKILGQQ